MRISPLRRARSAVRAGFTLIELLAVILIISILMTFLLPRIPVFIDKGEVTACQANMREIYSGFGIDLANMCDADNEVDISHHLCKNQWRDFVKRYRFVIVTVSELDVFDRQPFNLKRCRVAAIDGDSNNQAFSGEGLEHLTVFVNRPSASPE